AFQSSGLPGSDQSTLSIRGFGSPLVIVDGVETDFNRVNADEIETISVLKDASASIYGSRAGNGVILITTKRGAEGKDPSINFQATTTLQGNTFIPKMASAGQYAEMVNDGPAEPVYSEEEVRK